MVEKSVISGMPVVALTLPALFFSMNHMNQDKEKVFCCFFFFFLQFLVKLRNLVFAFEYN